MLCLCFLQFSYSQLQAQPAEEDLSPVQAGLRYRGGEDRVGAAVNTLSHDTILQ